MGKNGRKGLQGLLLPHFRWLCPLCFAGRSGFTA